MTYGKPRSEHHKKGRLFLGQIIFSVLLAATLVAPSTAQVRETPLATDLLDRLLSRYRSIQTLSAEFTQRLIGHNLEQEESGILLLKQPNKMYWEYREPRQKIFVADGKWSYFFVPEDNQVFEAELRLDTAETPLLFLFGKDDIKARYRVEYEMEAAPDNPENLLIRLTPRVPQAEFRYVLLEIDPGTDLIHRLVVVEPIGNENHYILRNIEENIKIPDRRFRFKIPDGVERIRQDPS